MVPNAPKWYETHQNVSLESNGLDRERSLRKILTRLRGTNFCTISARFAPNFVTQPNGPLCTKIVRNAPKHEFRVQWGGTGAFVAKNSDTASWHELLHQFGPFCTEFCKSTKWSQIHQIFLKCTKTFFLGSNGVDRVHSLRKIPTRLRCTTFCSSSVRFAPSFVSQPNGPKCTKYFMKCTKT